MWAKQMTFASMSQVNQMSQMSQPAPAPPQQPLRDRGVPPPAPVWLQRMSLVVLVLFCFYIGALLAILPWSPRYWDHNGWLLAHPAVEAVLNHGWVRGLVSGIGLIDIWIGVSELLHYRDLRS
jgi:hypothetical protein